MLKDGCLGERRARFRHPVIQFVAVVLLANGGQQLSAEDSAPKIDIIDTYGLEALSKASVIEASSLKVGDAVSIRPKEIVGRLERLPGVKRAAIQVVRAASPTAPTGTVTIVYIGIDEGLRAAPLYSETPSGDIVLPEEIITICRSREVAIQDAIRRGKWADIIRQGAGVVRDPTVRALQERLIPLVDRHFDTLKTVLRESKDPDQRKAAAEAMIFSPDRQTVAFELAAASRDPVAIVRNNAMAALAGILEDAKKQPAVKIDLPAGPFIEMLDALDWTDRNKAMAVLLQLADDRNEFVLQELRKRSLRNLAEMAGWKYDGHSGLAFILLGRIARLSDEQIFEAMKEAGRTEATARLVELGSQIR